MGPGLEDGGGVQQEGRSIIIGKCVWRILVIIQPLFHSSSFFSAIRPKNVHLSASVLATTAYIVTKMKFD